MPDDIDSIMSGISELRNHPYTRHWQKVLNEHWPKCPRDYPDRDGIDVWVRVVWARDGENWLPGHATRWGSWHVYVLVYETARRLGGHGVWVRPEDVRRRTEPRPPSSGVLTPTYEPEPPPY